MRKIRLSEYFEILVPNCPACRRDDAIVIDRVDANGITFRCSSCNRTLTRDEVDRGQREVEE